MKYLCIIQARLGSTRLPNKVMQTVGGIPMVKRVFHTATAFFAGAGKVIVAWPERYPDLDESNVLERFQRISKEFPSNFIVRLTADCPLLTETDLLISIKAFEKGMEFGSEYYNNRIDGRDVQIFTRRYLFDPIVTDKEHVIKDIPNTGGMSVNTKADLERVRAYAR